MRILRYIVPILGLVGLAVAVPAAATPPPVHYYIALGDSLSVGYQPAHIVDGVPVPAGNTTDGYVDDVFAKLKAKDPGLVEVKLGCSGETTTTMINGGICTYSDGSQLAQAEADLKLYGSAVKYVTLDIGANDVDSCAPGGSINASCVAKGLGTIGQNLVTILSGLHSADGGKPISVGMSYYDPFLAFYLDGTEGQAVATASVALLDSLNSELATEFAAYNFKGADVANAFKSGNFGQVQNDPPYGKLPINVRYICNYTYMCSVQNIHANHTGYQLIAAVFLAKL